MKSLLFLFVTLITLCGCESQPIEHESYEKSNIPSPPSSQSGHTDEQKTFVLEYSYAGLGSGYGSIQPTFSVSGFNYTYSLEQNSSLTGEFEKKPELICTGILRSSSVDSIINVVKDVRDTLVYRTNPDIMSGGIHYLLVKTDKINITFQLHNASHPNAQKIVDILNSNIPVDKQKLWLFDTINGK